MKWFGIDVERLSALAGGFSRLEDAIGRIGPLHDADGDRMRNEAHRLARDAIDTARRVLVEFTIGSLAARWFDEWGGEFSGWWVERHVSESTEADHVLSRVVDHPEMAGVFVDRLSNPEALVHGTNDTETLDRFWTSVTDPANVPEDVAIRRIRTLLLGLFADRYWENVPATRIEDPTMKTRHTLMMASVATAIASWQLNIPGMLGEIGSTTRDGRGFLERLAPEQIVAAEMRAELPAAFARTLEFLPERKHEQAHFIAALGFASGTILTGMQSWTMSEMATNLRLIREVGNILSLVPGPYLLTTVPASTMTLVMPSETRHVGLTDSELLDLHRLRIELANATANAFLDIEVAAGRHVRGSTEYSDELLYDMMTLRWAFDAPFERGRLWRALDGYYDIEVLEKDVVDDPSKWLEILDRNHITQAN